MSEMSSWLKLELDTKVLLKKSGRENLPLGY